MPEQIYNWKRFWCPRTAQMNFSGDYLADPEQHYNPELVELEAIADIPCLVLLGEPGSGKSRELENLKALTEKKIGDPDQVLVLNLRSCTNLKEDLFKDEIFTDWLKGSYHLYLFLDSLDEGLLSIPTLAIGLIDELQKPKYRNRIHRLHLRLACRTFLFPVILEEGLEELWQKDHFAIYELAPLRCIDVIEAAKAEGFYPDDFLKELDQKNVVSLAIKPITLKFLLNTYRKHNGQFPPNQKLYELYHDGCKLLCTEVSKSRRASGQVGNFDDDQRLIVAARIAAITIFANRFAVWIDIDQGDVPVEDVLLQRLCFGREKVNENAFEITSKVVREALDTGLFSSRGENRMGWAHQTYAEFLAAWYLSQYNLALSQILSLIIHPDGRVIPQLQETVAWLASMRSDVFQKIMETDPDVLLQSDLATIDETVKASLVESLLDLYDRDKLVYQYRYRSYESLKHPKLALQLQSYILDSAKSINSRYIAIEIAEICKEQAVQSSLANVALNTNQSYWIRVRAANALVSIGDDQTKKQLMPLAFGGQDDLEDELKGHALQAVYPIYMTTEEALNCLTQSKASYIGGHYQHFVAEVLGQRIPVSDLSLALNWLEQQSIRRDLDYPFDQFSDAIMLRAWEHLEQPEILPKFAQITFLRLSQDDDLINSREVSFKQLLEKSEVKRRQLLEAVIAIIPESDKEPLWLAGYNEYSQLTPLKQDFLWLIEKLQTSKSDHIQRVYSKLVRWQLDWHDSAQRSAVLVASKNNLILKAELSLELESTGANFSKANQAQDNPTSENKQKLLDPSPKERVLMRLNQFEAGSVDAWWHLCRDMTLLPHSTHFNRHSLIEPDLEILPGWQEADEETRLRIIAAAKNYIYSGEPETDAWIDTNSFRDSALAGYKALRLILVKDPDFISAIPANIWAKWVAIILSYPNDQNGKGEENRKRLIQRAYQNAPEEFVKALDILIERENTQRKSVHIHHQIRCCWDERLAEVLLSKVKDEKLTVRSMGDLLEELLAHQVDRAKTFAESLISLPLPANGEARERAIMAAQLLMLYSEDAGWSVVWSAIQQDSKFGREVLEAVSYAAKHQGNIEQRLKEDCVADLYIFLVQQYPNLDEQQKNSDDLEIIGIEAYIARPEDSIRTWRDCIPQRLQERATPAACVALRKMINVLPELKDKLQPRLLEAEALVRRKTWKPPTPEEFLQLVIGQEPSNFDLSNKLDIINRRTKEMADEPKIENNINISNSPINAPIGTSGVTNSQVTVPNSEDKNGVNWGNRLAVIGILVAIIAIPLSMSVSGAFNEEFKQWLNHIFPSKVEQQPTPKSN